LSPQTEIKKQLKSNIRFFISYHIILGLLAIALLFFIIIPIFESATTYTIIESFCSFIALSVGFFYFYCFQELKSTKLLLIGSLFVFSGIIDLSSCIIVSPQINQYLDLDLLKTSSILWGIKSNIFAICFIYFSNIPNNNKKQNTSLAIYSLLAILAAGLFVLIIVVLPKINVIYPEHLLARPLDLVATILFIICAFLNLNIKNFRSFSFSSIIFIFLFLSVFSELAITFSTELHDRAFLISLVLKLASYLSLFLGIHLKKFSQIKKNFQTNFKNDINFAKIEKQYAYLIENLNIGIYRNTLEPDSKILHANPATAKILGYANIEDLKKATALSFYKNPNDRTQFIKELSKDGIIKEKILHLKKKNGTPVLISCTASITNDKNGNPKWIDGIIEDITEKKIAKEELQRAHDELELRVENRTKEYTETTNQLKQEITKRENIKKKLEKRAVQLSLLNNISRAISSELKLDSLLDMVTSLVKTNFGYHLVGFFLYNKESEEPVLELVSVDGNQHKMEIGGKVPISSGMIGWTAKHGKRILANDIREEHRYINNFPDKMLTMSELTIPIIVGEEIVGVFDVQSPKLNAFGENDIILMETIADQLARSIENSRLYESIQYELYERKKAEGALIDSEEKFRLMVENSPEGIIIFDENLNIIYANERLSQITGYSLAEITKQDFKTTLNKNTLTIIESTAKNKKLNIVNRQEIELKRKNNERVFVEISTSIIKSSEDETLTMAQLLDITKRRRLQEQLKQYTIDLEEQVKQRTNELIQAEKMASMGQLIAGVAHEINNPLAYIKCNTQILKEDLPKLKGHLKKTKRDVALYQQFENLISTNMDGVDRIATITKTLKRFSKPQEETPEFANINQGIRDTLLIVGNQLKHRIKVNTNYADLPLTNCIIGQLNQVFMNMILNASQAMETGCINIKTYMKNETISIEIQDNGHGIPKEIVNKVFDPFFSTKPKGSGLGLSICYKIIKDHNGDINVASTVGKGTKFTIKIPNKQ